jgi:hypothetical protein
VVYTTYHPLKRTHELLFPSSVETGGGRTRVCVYISKSAGGAALVVYIEEADLANTGLDSHLLAEPTVRVVCPPPVISTYTTLRGGAFRPHKIQAPTSSLSYAMRLTLTCG